MFSREGHVYSARDTAGIDARFADFERQRADRVRRERDLEHTKNDLDKAEGELKACSKRIEDLNEEAAKAATQARAIMALLSELDAKLKPFANLEEESRQQHEIQDKNAQNQKLYLGAKPLADSFGERREVVRKSLALESEATGQVQKKRKRLPSRKTTSMLRPRKRPGCRQSSGDQAGDGFARIEERGRGSQAGERASQAVERGLR